MYFLALDTGFATAEEAIDWLEMQRCSSNQHAPITSAMLTSGMQDMIIKELNRDMYYFTKKVCFDLSPDSELPSDDRRSLNKGRFAGLMIRTIPELQQAYDPVASASQPIIAASILKRTLNFLDSSSAKVKDEPVLQAQAERTTYLVPEYCEQVNMKASVVAMALLFPSFSVRLDSYLFAVELNERMGTSINLNLLVDAITACQARHGRDYERLEYLGDAYLKLITSVAVYLQFPRYHEGLLTMERTAILENKNLRSLAIKQKL